jgi:hypothetical protein
MMVAASDAAAHTITKDLAVATDDAGKIPSRSVRKQ